MRTLLVCSLSLPQPAPSDLVEWIREMVSTHSGIAVDAISSDGEDGSMSIFAATSEEVETVRCVFRTNVSDLHKVGLSLAV